MTADGMVPTTSAGGSPSRWSVIWPSAVTAIGALLVGWLIVLAVSDNPIPAYGSFLFGSFSSWSSLGNALARATPLILIALGVVVSFRAGIFNVGGEGQLYVGALAGSVSGLAVVDVLPGPLVAVVVCLAAAAVGAAWAWFPGVLRARLGLNEVVTTLMLNFVAILLTGYLATDVVRDTEAYGASTAALPDAALLPTIINGSSMTLGFFLAVLVAVVVAFVVSRTTWGIELRTVGTNPRFAEAVGYDHRRILVQSMMVAGALAGLAGAFEVLSPLARFNHNFSPELGLLAITVALLGRLNAWGALLAAIFYALLLNGSAIMQLVSDVPRAIVSVVAALIVLLVTARLRRGTE